LDFTIHKGEKGKIVTDSDTATWMELRSNLPNDDVSRPNDLPAKLFDSPPLPIGIPTITAGPLSFLMCHCSRTAKIFLTP
jgi:hypothetical protein